MEWIKRENGLHVLHENMHGAYKKLCMCHLCDKSKNLAPLSICPTLAKLWAISSEHKVIVTVSECMNFEERT